MDDGTFYTIGDLARLTGLTVKTIRFWSDTGVVPPTDRTPAGYRLYDEDALARLGLVRTLLDLGIDLATIQQVLDREITVAEVAAVHAEALEVHIRTLRLRQAVLRAVAGRGATPEEMELMHKLATLSDQERHRLIHDFVNHAFDGLDLDPEFLATMRSTVPELPRDPTPEQIGAWVELAELVQDDAFRTAMRQAAADQIQARAEAGAPDPEAARRLSEMIQQRTTAARTAGIAPDSAAARPVLDELVEQCAQLTGHKDGPEYRTWLLRRLEIGHNSGYARYQRLLAVMHGRPVEDDLTEALTWLIAALHAAQA